MLGVRQGCVLSPLLFNKFMADLPLSLNQDSYVRLDDDSKMNCIIWADDLVLLSENEAGLEKLLEDLKTYSDKNKLEINVKKTKCMIFNKTGRLIHKKFYLGRSRIENVRTYKYLGLVITPSGEIKSALDDLRSRALKAYMSLKTKLGACFKEYVDDTISLFDTLVKPILLYGSDFWGCLKCPKNNPIENLHMQFCKQLLGVQKNTTNYGVLLEVGRVPLMGEARSMSIKNWDRIKNKKANQIIIKSHENSLLEDLNWTKTIKDTLAEHGLQIFYSQPELRNKHLSFLKRANDIFHQNAFSAINDDSSKLRTYSLIKEIKGREDYLTKIRNFKSRTTLTKFRLSNHKLRIELGRRDGTPREERTCQICHDGVEDEIHLLVKCKQYEELRAPLINMCRELKPQFCYYTDKEKFMFIMKTPLLTDVMTKFLTKTMNDREIFLEVARSLQSIVDEVAINCLNNV